MTQYQIEYLRKDEIFFLPCSGFPVDSDGWLGQAIASGRRKHTENCAEKTRRVMMIQFSRGENGTCTEQLRLSLRGHPTTG